MKPDLMALVGQRVTVADPHIRSSWTGKLVAVCDDPSLVIEVDQGVRMTLPQRFLVTPPPTEPDPRPFPSHSVGARLVINGEPLHIRARLGIDDNHAGDDAVQRRWWADLAFHPLKPPNEDTECTLSLGGRPGKGRILAGSTRMQGDGPPPTIARWERLATDPGNADPADDTPPEPKSSARQEVDPDSDHVIHAHRHPWLNADDTPSAPQWATIERDGHVTYTWPNVPPTADIVAGARVHGLLDRQLDRLAETLFNSIDRLEQHIDQRAQELARPLIADAHAAAFDEVKSAQRAQQYAEDLVTELRRQLAALERNRDRYKERAELAEAAIARVRYLSNLTIGSSCRAQAIDQARDTLRELDSQGDDRG